jgi:RNA polymerase sigma-70 factor (ECF subfamily)
MTESCVSPLWAVAALDDAPVHPAPHPGEGPGADPEEMIAGLYADYRAFILSYVTGLLKDRYLAEDVVQETMLRAWRHCAQFSAEKGSVRGWLMKVAHNIAMDKVRMRRSRPAEVTEDAVPEALVTEDHSDTVLTSLQVRHALAGLSPGHRDVLELIYMNGCTARETAARLGIPEGTVFSRAFYALRILRRELGPAPGAVELRTAWTASADSRSRWAS